MGVFSGEEPVVPRRDVATLAAWERAPAGVGRRVRGISTVEMLFLE
jgi:hypothetical protein